MRNIELKTGDVIQLHMNNGLVLCWKIVQFQLGGIGQESVVELRTFGREENILRSQLFIPSQLLDVLIEYNIIRVYKVNPDHQSDKDKTPQKRTVQFAEYILNHFSRSSVKDFHSLAFHLEDWARIFVNLENENCCEIDNG